MLSTLLCSLYYSAMEKELLEVQEGELLLRIVDDYLYITPFRTKAESFLSAMMNGELKYCHVCHDER